MRNLKTIKLLPVLMLLSILAIAAFQYYWLQKAYEREERTLDMRTNFMFRETVRAVQTSKLKLDRFIDSARPQQLMFRHDKDKIKIVTPEKPYQESLFSTREAKQ